MVLEERPPGLWWWPVAMQHVLRDRGLADINAKFQQLTMNPWRAPQRIVARHSQNQGPHIRRDRRSHAAAPTLPGPKQAEALAMPGDEGLRLHDHECRAPTAPRT